jgi:hypothetical protein
VGPIFHFIFTIVNNRRIGFICFKSECQMGPTFHLIFTIINNRCTYVSVLSPSSLSVKGNHSLDNCCLIRVTRLGEFLPIRRLLTLGSFLKFSSKYPNFGLLPISDGKSFVLILIKMYLTNASGHPVSN